MPSAPFQSAQLEPAFWTQPLTETLSALGNGTTGLSKAEANRRLRRFGLNQLQVSRERALVVRLLLRFNNPLVLILLAASAVSAFTGEKVSLFIIGVIVVMSVTLDFVQEVRAATAADRLKQRVAVRALVLRDGQPIEVPLTEVVPGDMVQLAAGDLVPADAILVESKDLFVNQALLTGEAYPVEKDAQPPAQPADDLGAATHAVFMGSSVVSGSALALICRTGAKTALGEIAGSLASRAPPTAFEQGTRQFGALIMRLTTLLVLFVLMVNVLLHRPLMESFLFAIALAVGLTPELLPMVVSVTLSRGALRMAKRHVIIKRLPVIHNLGSMDVLCTDKTGTLTEARIALARHVDPQGHDATGVLRLACLNSHFESGLRSPLDEAILAHAHADANIAGWRKIDEVPFDFERRRVSVLVDDGHTRLLVVKGAPEDIVRLCTRCAVSDPLEASRPMDGPARAEVQTLHDRLAAEGLRVLGIAWRLVPEDHPHAKVDDETDLVFGGFVAFLDPPKASAAAALKALEASGVAVKVVTGDNEIVTRHLCERLGMPVTGVLTGAQVQHMDDNALGASVESVNLFCRVTPSQKNRIILAIKARGHTVGYLGDGVNDAPSLHSADVGISVDGAVDVAKEAADMILLKHDLRVLHEGVIEGRRTFGNIMKYIMMGTSSNFGNMFSMAAAALFLPFLPMLPVQILLNNLLYDLSEIAIPTDRVDPGYVARPRHWDMRFIRNFMLVIGPVSSAFDLLMYFVLLRVFDADEALFHTGWFIESMCTQVLVIFVIRTRGSPLRSRPSGWLIATSLAAVAIALLLPLAPFASRLGFVAPPPLYFLVLAAMTTAYLFAVEGAKRVFYVRLSGRGAATGRARKR